MVNNLGVRTVRLQRLDDRRNGTGLDQFRGISRRQRVQRGERVAVNVHILRAVQHAVDQGLDATGLYDDVADLWHLPQLPERPGAIKLYTRVFREAVQIPDDWLDGPRIVPLPGVLGVVGGVRDEVLRVRLGDGVVRKRVHGLHDGRETARVEDLPNVLHGAAAVKRENSHALLVCPLVLGAAHHGGDHWLDAVPQLVNGLGDAGVLHD
mmetsp:Transcript_46724/g.130088  ORF Transcript_46724/g.130088 Transcript_46724/m.130088 type:complete len:209 (+) Transcript_46724:2250-2876(+)